jgi:hypothetical protein
VPRTFNPAQPIAPKDFSHAAFVEVLRAHVQEGVVNYPAIAADPRFQAYLQLLDRVDPYTLLARQERLAF